MSYDFEFFSVINYLSPNYESYSLVDPENKWSQRKETKKFQEKKDIGNIGKYQIEIF